MQNAAKKQLFFYDSAASKKDFNPSCPIKMRHSFLPLCQRGHLPHACVPEWGVHGKMMAREEKQTQTHSCKTTRTVRKEFYCGENLKYDAEGTCKGGN